MGEIFDIVGPDGLIVVEASSKGTPSVVARAPDNAAVELVEDGVNGVIAESASPMYSKALASTYFSSAVGREPLPPSGWNARSLPAAMDLPSASMILTRIASSSRPGAVRLRTSRSVR